MNMLTSKRAVVDETGVVVGFCSGHADGPVLPDGIAVQPGWTWTASQGFKSPVEQAPDFDQLAMAAYNNIDAGCERAITSGFCSEALGAPYTYSSALEDQLNLTNAALLNLDTGYPCRDETGVKTFRMHTAAQLQQVCNDFTTHKLALLQRANELKLQVDQAVAAQDEVAIKAVDWEGSEL
ncbi:hypothetical protein ACFW6U_08265 [Pseudomonas guariconensis]|uniref:DUF4376 domain-containing protein n=1 Tax=Pseudomonas guariconensis TaxID=1288410 RepID=UPI00366F3BFE